MAHSWESFIHGHHVYKAFWTPDIGEILECRQERGNSEDLYTISVKKDDVHSGAEEGSFEWYGQAQQLFNKMVGKVDGSENVYVHA